jgi:MFS transporter, DHA1 family, tetracycline resistance protein
MADRYARLHHNYTGEYPCSHYNRHEKPDACQAGADQAQAAATASNLGVCLLAFFGNPVVGSFSDAVGRRNWIRLSLLLTCIPALCFVLMMQHTGMDPAWYFTSNTLTGLANLVSLSLAALADRLPTDMRAPGFGLLMVGTSGAYAIAPTLAVYLTPWQTAASSLAWTVAAAIVSYTCLPETLSLNHRNMHDNDYHATSVSLLNDEPLSERGPSCLNTLQRPCHDLLILNSDVTIRLIAAASFLSNMVFAADGTIVVYYIEDQLNVRQRDVASLFLVLGFCGVFTQGVLIRPLTKLFGEKTLLVMALACGGLHNTLYGSARSKNGIYAAFAIAQLTRMNFPLLSSLASRDVSAMEQGRLQGALFALNAVASAVGPLTMQWIYHETKHATRRLGPGTMFYYGAILYVTAAVLAMRIPTRCEEIRQDNDLCEPLLAERPETDLFQDPEGEIVFATEEVNANLASQLKSQP